MSSSGPNYSFSDQGWRPFTVLHSSTVTPFNGGLPGVINQRLESRPRASKASIEAMPQVKVAYEEGDECSICLVGLKVGDELKELPCKHRFHGDCIEKWMGMSTLCPLCRFSLPAESEEEVNSDNIRNYINLTMSFIDAALASDIQSETHEEENTGGEWDWDTSTVDEADDHTSFRLRFNIDAVNELSDDDGY
ncbi:E3 ubiquitin-protein ligase MPSR1-like [Argentina anserina]|uniref:E3 ubiquitin-protein ligase MPSR1-like n=1 Tax=Argentina anserina TaxID=57926 RepID=UPI0021762E77|nr:E3 ubiquitin-protein ligase MPSR1-like [Potentilla anserina]